jgi:hypothetical protein
VKVIQKTVAAFFASAEAHVIRVGNERLFVVFKGSDATNWMQNMECAHTEPLGELFGARGSDLRLHAGFYAGWKALEADVRQAVLSFAKEVSSSAPCSARVQFWDCGFGVWPDLMLEAKRLPVKATSFWAIGGQVKHPVVLEPSASDVECPGR